MNTKIRRHSGRRHAPIYDYENQIYDEEYWDEWVDYRDGYRDLHRDRTLKKPNYQNPFYGDFDFKKTNNKIKKLNRRRKIMRTLRPK